MTEITELPETVPADVRCGDFIDGYQVMAQAPVEYIQGTRRRQFGKHLVKGSWSDPWWAYCPERGWAIVKRWKNKDTTVDDGWDRERHRRRLLPFPARNELVVFPRDQESGSCDQ